MGGWVGGRKGNMFGEPAELVEGGGKVAAGFKEVGEMEGEVVRVSEEGGGETGHAFVGGRLECQNDCEKVVDRL